MLKKKVLAAALAASLAFPALAAEKSIDGVATRDIKATLVGNKLSHLNPWSKAGTACILAKESTWRYLKLHLLKAQVLVTFVPGSAGAGACGLNQKIAISVIENQMGIKARSGAAKSE
jgi:hypothetical protein